MRCVLFFNNNRMALKILNRNKRKNINNRKKAAKWLSFLYKSSIKMDQFPGISSDLDYNF